METRYLIDTCTVIKYLQENFSQKALIYLDELLDDKCQISFITQIELLSWNSSDETSISILNQFIKGSRILYINNQIINKVIEIRKESKIKIPDAIIAATAICNNYTLISDNDKDFKKTFSFGLKYLNPRSIK